MGGYIYGERLKALASSWLPKDKWGSVSKKEGFSGLAQAKSILFHSNFIISWISEPIHSTAPTE